MSFSFDSCSKLFSGAGAVVIGSTSWRGQSNEGKWQGHRGRKGDACKNREVGGYISLSGTWPLLPVLDADRSGKAVHSPGRARVS